MNDIHELERQLKKAEERHQRAMKALAPKHKGGEWEEYWAANREVLRLERLLAAAKGEEYAELCDFPLKWDREAGECSLERSNPAAVDLLRLKRSKCSGALSPRLEMTKPQGCESRLAVVTTGGMV